MWELTMEDQNLATREQGRWERARLNRTTQRPDGSDRLADFLLEYRDLCLKHGVWMACGEDCSIFPEPREAWERRAQSGWDFYRERGIDLPPMRRWEDVVHEDYVYDVARVSDV